MIQIYQTKLIISWHNLLFITTPMFYLMLTISIYRVIFFRNDLGNCHFVIYISVHNAVFVSYDPLGENKFPSLHHHTYANGRMKQIETSNRTIAPIPQCSLTVYTVRCCDIARFCPIKLYWTTFNGTVLLFLCHTLRVGVFSHRSILFCQTYLQRF